MMVSRVYGTVCLVLPLISSNVWLPDSLCALEKQQKQSLCLLSVWKGRAWVKYFLSKARADHVTAQVSHGCKPTFTAVLFTRAKRGEVTYTTTHRWMYKQHAVTHGMEYYSTLTKKEILTHTVTWMNLETVSGTNQSQKDKYDPTYMWDLKHSNS